VSLEERVKPSDWREEYSIIRILYIPKRSFRLTWHPWK
jgi:hypothetical protein